MSGIDFDSRISYEPYHIYYDLNILNNDTTGTKQPPFLQFTEIRNSPYINNPSDYFCSVVRFSVETPTLPLLIPQAVVGQSPLAPTFPNQLIYTVSFNHPTLAAPITTNVLYVPQSSATLAPPPSSITSASDIINEYYYTYTYKPFIDMINTALRTNWNILLTTTAVGAQIQGAGFTAEHFPYLWWDEESNIATWVALAQVFQTPTANNPTPTLFSAVAPFSNTPVQIFFNTELYNLFSSFSAFQNGYGGATPLGLNWRMNMPDTITVNPYLANVLAVGAVPPSASMPTFPATGNGVAPNPPPAQPSQFSLLRVSQEYPTTPLWNPVQAIVFTTSLLPIASSIVSAPVLFGQGQQFTNAGNNSGIANILTDLEVPTEKGWQTKPLISYVPTAEYRLFDLNGNAPLSAIEITVNWKDTFGRLNQFRLGAGSNASIKLMFRRKDFQGVV